MATVQYPLTDGDYHSWSSCELKFNGNIYVGVKSFNAKDSLKPTKVRGTPAEPLGRTRGDYDAEGDMEMYAQQGNEFIQALGNGYKEKIWNATITLSENGLDTIQHEVIGCRIEEVDSSNSQSPDPSTIKFTLNVLKVKFGGLESLSNPLSGAIIQG